jgi:hypothetical protein
MAGTFRYRTRLKETPMLVLEQLIEIVPDGASCAVKMFETSAGNKLCAEGDFFYHQATFFVFAECTDPPHQPLIYAFRDPLTAEIMSLNGVSIVPHSIGPNMGSPLMRLVYVWRDGVPVSVEFDPERGVQQLHSGRCLHHADDLLSADARIRTGARRSARPCPA